VSKPIKIPGIKSTKLFNARTVTRDELIAIASKFHRGDVGLCNYVVGLIEQIADLRGFAPIGLVDVEPNRIHAWTIRAHNSHEDAWANAPSREMSTEIIDFMSVNGHHKWVALHYMGKRPEPVDVALKVREIGARTIGGI
jgi:hypothetical protein